MRSLRLVLAGMLVAVGLVALTPTAAHACFCLPGSARQQVAWSDAVFTGTFTRYAAAPEGLQGYRFDVHEVFSGDLSATTDVGSHLACGLERMEVGTTYLVFAARDDGLLMSSSCSGTGPVSPARVAAVEDLTGPGRQPVPDLATLLAEILGLFAWPS